MTLEELYSFFKKNTKLDFVITNIDYTFRLISSINASNYYINEKLSSYKTYDLIKKGLGKRCFLKDNSFSKDALKENEQDLPNSIKNKNKYSGPIVYPNGNLRRLYVAKCSTEYPLRNLDADYFIYNNINDLINSLNNAIRNFQDIVTSRIDYSFFKEDLELINSNNVKFRTIDLASKFEITIVVNKEGELLTSFRSLSLTSDFNSDPFDIIESMYQEALLSFNKFNFKEAKYRVLLPNYLVSSLFYHLKSSFLDLNVFDINGIPDLNIVSSFVLDNSFPEPCFSSSYYPISQLDIVRNGKYVYKRKDIKKLFNKKYVDISSYDFNSFFHFSILPSDLETKSLINNFKDGVIITRIFGEGFSAFNLEEDKFVIPAHGFFIKDGNILGFNYFRLVFDKKQVLNNITAVGSDVFYEFSNRDSFTGYLFSSPTLVIDNVEVYDFSTFRLISDSFRNS